MHKEPKTDILSLNKQAMESLRKGYTSQALRLLKAAEKHLISGSVQSSPAKSWAITFNNLGCYYKRVQKPVVALHYLKKALDIEEKSSEDSLNLAGTHLNICAIRSQLNDHEKALASAANAIKILSTYPDRSQNVMSTLIIAHQNAGLEYSFMNQRAEAAKYFQLGWNLAKEHLGNSHQLTKTLRNSYLSASEKSPQRYEFKNTHNSSKSSRKAPISELPTIHHKPYNSHESSSDHFRNSAQYSRNSVSYETNSRSRHRKTAHSNRNSAYYYRNSVNYTGTKGNYKLNVSENKNKSRRKYTIEQPRKELTPRRLVVRPINPPQADYYIHEPYRDAYTESSDINPKKSYKESSKEFDQPIYKVASRESRNFSYNNPHKESYKETPNSYYYKHSYAEPSYKHSYAEPSYKHSYAEPSYKHSYAEPSKHSYAEPSYKHSYAETSYKHSYAEPSKHSYVEPSSKHSYKSPYKNKHKNSYKHSYNESVKEFNRESSKESNRDTMKESLRGSAKESSLENARGSYISSGKESDCASIGVQVIIPDNIDSIREKAAVNIQKSWRGYFCRKQERERSLNEAIYLAELRAQTAIGELQRLRSKKESMHSAPKDSFYKPMIPIPQTVRKDSLLTPYNH